MSNQPNSSKSNAPTFDQLLDQAKMHLRQQHIQQAETLFDQLLAINPRHFQVNFYKAVCRRAHGEHAKALEYLQAAIENKRDYGRAWQEIGHNHRDQQQWSKATAAYQQAVELNPGLLASWRELAQLLLKQGQSEQAQSAQANYDRLKKLPQLLQSVTSMMHEGRLYKAEKLCRHFLKENPKHTEGMRLLAAIGTELNVLDDAEFLLESALEFEPSFDLARMDYVKVLHKRQKFQKAFDQAVELRRRLPNNLASEMVYANQCAAIGRYEEALQVLDPLVAISPNPANVEMQRGHAYKTIGQQQQAIGAYQSAAGHRPEFGDAWWSLANMKVHKFSEDDLATMHKALASDQASTVDQYHLHFALGKAYEDNKDYETSFAHYAKGNALKKNRASV